MKSSFMFLVVICCLVSTLALGQTQKKSSPSKSKKTLSSKIAPAKKVTTLAPAPEVAKVENEVLKTPFQKFSDRLTIGYFAAFASPNFHHWDSRYAALSPKFSGGSNRDSYAMNLWNQVNFGYNFGAKMRFNVIPRYTIFLGNPKDQGPGESGTILLEDALVGFSGVVFTSENKKFNWWMRPGARLPTSHGTRHNINKEFGRLNYNLEIVNMFSYDFNTTWQLALTFQDRYWIYNQRYNPSHNRYYLAPNFTYTVNETTKIQGFYEVMLDNTRRWETINGAKPSYRSMWQNAYIGVAKDVTPKLNLYPFISCYVDTTPFSSKAFWLGAWISYQIK